MKKILFLTLFVFVISGLLMADNFVSYNSSWSDGYKVIKTGRTYVNGFQVDAFSNSTSVHKVSLYDTRLTYTASSSNLVKEFIFYPKDNVQPGHYINTGTLGFVSGLVVKFVADSTNNTTLGRVDFK